MSRPALTASALAPNLWLGDGVAVPADAQIGVNVVIHAGTQLGAGVVIDDGAILGRTPRLSAASSAPRRAAEPLVVGDGATICAGAVVFAGAQLGAGVIVGDQAHVRERAVVGAGSMIGRGSAIGNDARLGARVRLQSMVWITGWTLVEDDVFVGPGVMTMNDDSMARLAPGTPLTAPVLRRACRVGGGVLLTPGVEVGEEAFVASGAVVSRDVPARSVVMGVPGRVNGTVPEEQLLERWRPSS